MTYFIKKFLLTCLITIIVFSCANDDNVMTPEVPDMEVTGVFNAEIEGVPFTVESISGSASSNRINANSVGTIPSEEAKIFFGMSMLRFPEIGTYDMQVDEDYSMSFSIGGGQGGRAFFAQSGEMTILSHDVDNNIITGTFVFTARELGVVASVIKLVTNGEFEVHYEILN